MNVANKFDEIHTNVKCSCFAISIIIKVPSGTVVVTHLFVKKY